MSTILDDLKKKTGGINELSCKVGKSKSLMYRAEKNKDKLEGYALNLALKLKQDIKLESIENGRIITIEITYKKRNNTNTATVL